MGHCHPLADCSQVTSSLAITLTKYPTSSVLYSSMPGLDGISVVARSQCVAKTDAYSFLRFHRQSRPIPFMLTAGKAPNAGEWKNDHNNNRCK